MTPEETFTGRRNLVVLLVSLWPEEAAGAMVSEVLVAMSEVESVEAEAGAEVIGRVEEGASEGLAAAVRWLAGCGAASTR
jgi:hypothetical protein